MSTRVAIVGAGIVGCSAAVVHARAGAEVTIFEASGVAAGASGRNSGAVEHPFDREQVELYEGTLAALRTLDGFPLPDEPEGMLLLTAEEGEAEAVCVEYATRFPELRPAVLTPADVSAREPHLAPGLWACLLNSGYMVPPALATQLYAVEALAAGARLRSACPVELVRDGRRAALRVDGAIAEFDAVLLATGWETGRLAETVGVRLPVSASWGVTVIVEGVVSRAVLQAAEVAAVQAGPRDPTVAHSSFSLITAAGEAGLGSTFLPEEPDVIEWTRRLLEDGARYVPGLSGARVTMARACPRPLSADGRPILGRVPGFDQLFVAAGHGGRGISTGVRSAQLVAEAILGGDDGAIPLPLRAERFG